MGSTTADLPKSAALYARISLDRRGEELGVTRQIEDCRAKAAALGWTLWDGDPYVDNDKSASKEEVKRDNYLRMLEDLRTGKRDGVVVYDLDRLTRRPIELEEFMKLAEGQGIPLANVSGDVDLTTGNGRMIARIKGAVARQEADRIAERVSREAKQRADKGLPHGGGRYPLFGYTRRYEVIPEQAALVQDAVARVLTGEGMATVVRDWNEKGLRTASGKEWERAVFVKMLTNPAHAGLRRYKGEIVADATWEAIIDRESHYKLVALMESRKRGTPEWAAGQTGYIVKYLLSGIAVCGLCTAPMYVAAVKRLNGTSTERLVCRSKPLGCGRMVRINAPVERLVREAYFARVEQQQVKAVVPVTDHSDEIATLEAEIEEYAQLKEAGDLTMKEYIRFAKPHRERIKELRAEDAKNARALAAQSKLGREGVRAAWKSASLQDKREMLKREIEAVVVKPAKSAGRRKFDPDCIEIVWADQRAA